MQTIHIIAGPTASGKTAAAVTFAKDLLAQGHSPVIINADSMQVYKEIPIITNQPTAEEQSDIPHCLFAVLSADTRCSVGMWVAMAQKEIDHAFANKHIPILVGGTGMYISALIHGIAPIPDIEPDIRKHTYNLFDTLGNKAFFAELKKCDPLMADRLESGDTQRILRAYEVIKQTGISLIEWQEIEHMPPYKQEQFSGVFINPDREQLYAKINTRFEHMIEQGVLEEISAFETLKLDPSLPVMKAHGVPELIRYLRHEMTLEDAIAKAQQNTRHYAKRQITWFKNQLPELKETPDANIL